MAAFDTPQEEAACTMLKQVLQNHIATYNLSFISLVIVITGLLGDHCKQFCEAGTDTQKIVLDTCAWLKRRVREHQGQSAFSLLHQEEISEDEALLDEQSFRTYDALSQLLNDVVTEQGFDGMAGMRICLGLAADIFSLFLHEFDHTLEALEQFIDEDLSAALRSHILLEDPPREC
jgi:hypothetical protein